MMQQFAETGGEMVAGAAAGKAIGLISKSLKGAGVGFKVRQVTGWHGII